MAKKAEPDDSAPLPSTLERSPRKAKATYEKTLASAEQSYEGDEARAHRAAWSAVKHSFEKVGDHWEPKDERGPSDPRAAGSGPNASGASYGGVDFKGKSKDELLEEARRLDARVTTRMTKSEVAEAIARENERATRAARER